MTKMRLLIWGLAVYYLLCSPRTTEGIIGYDCNGATLNITTVSLLEVGECNIPLQEVNETSVHIQLLQINQYASIHVRQCKVEIYRIIRRCGMWSHGMDVPNGEYSYIDSVSRDECLDMYKLGKIKIGQTEVHRIHANQTVSRPISIAGTINHNSECEGVYYSDPYGSWEKVFVKGTVKISLRDYEADVDVNTNKVLLRSGTKCDLNDGRCTDIDGGDTYWDPFPEDSCHSKRYGVLYEGPAKRTTDVDTKFKQTMYSLTEGDIIFALTAKERINVCGYSLILTEHPKLLIVETRKNEPFVKKEPIHVGNLDLFSYVNSKFVYVEKYIRTQMKQMYQDILIQRCNLEKQVIENTIGLAKQSPDEFAYNIMKGPGYMALLAGEVAHIVKCIPLEVRIQQTTECYTQLPVKVANSSYFLTPRTHIIKKTGTQITCNHLVPAMYKIKGTWYSLEPQPRQATSPTILKPLTEHTWEYRNPQTLATSGIYTQKDLDDLRDHIMFPAERPAILNSVARGIAGQPTITQGGTIANLIDEQTINKIIESSWEKSWGYFSTFGTVSAGLIGIVIVIRGIKLIIDTLIHGYALHTVYGWSLYLIGAFWDSVTHLLIHLGKKPPAFKKDDNDDDNGPAATAPLISKDTGTQTQKPASFEPLQFGFDPRIYDLQRAFESGDEHRGFHLPVRSYPCNTLPTRLNPTYKAEVPTTPSKKYMWRDGKNTGIMEEIYATIPAGIREYRPPSVNQEIEMKEMTSETEPKDTRNSHEELPSVNDADKDEVQQSIYPTLEKIKNATIHTPRPEKRQMFLSLQKQTYL